MLQKSGSGKKKRNPEKILVIRLSAIGDVVRTVPAVQAVRERFPESIIHWLVEDRCAEMITGLELIDALRIVARRQWKQMSLLKRLYSFLKLIQSLRHEQYDVVVDFHGILKSGLYTRLSGSRRRIGYPRGIAKEWNTFLTNEKVTVKPHAMSRYKRNFLLASHLDPNACEKRPVLPVTPTDHDVADYFLASHHIESGSAIFMYPGTSARGRYKRWPPERYGQLSDMIQQQLRRPVLLGWGPGEEQIVSTVVGSAKKPITVLPKTTMKELSAFIAASRMFVGGDTGPMHIASLVGTPVLTIFGPSDPVINEPARFTPFRIVYAGVDCSPCRKKDCDHLTCLTSISPEMVFESLLSLLNEDR